MVKKVDVTPDTTPELPLPESISHLGEERRAMVKSLMSLTDNIPFPPDGCGAMSHRLYREIVLSIAVTEFMMGLTKIATEQCDNGKGSSV